jgi:tetratricopeptide (TPR) repeat protein
MLHPVASKPIAKAASSAPAASVSAAAAKPEEKAAATAPAQAAAPAQATAPAQAETAVPAQPVAPIVKPRPELAPGASYLEAARRAFEAGDIEWTMHYYNTYLDSHPNDANAWGELGNVYNSQGMELESAQSYYNAANLLIDQGKTAHALDLLPAIQAGSQDLANSIYWRLTSVNQ